jgi:(p)ppGpp synthase/HD superfamily hydrolase
LKYLNPEGNNTEGFAEVIQNLPRLYIKPSSRDDYNGFKELFTLTGGAPLLSEKYLEAFKYAFEKHKDQIRKGSDVPYISHLMAVSGLVIEHGGNEEEAIAALLHDVVEDQGGREALAEIRSLFGDRVAEIVDHCTDVYTNPKPPWEPRKTKYIEEMRGADPSVLLVSLCDKLHNARSTLLDLQYSASYEEFWKRFSAPPEKQLWYYKSLLEIYQDCNCCHRALVNELRRVVEELEILIEENGNPSPVS